MKTKNKKEMVIYKKYRDQDSKYKLCSLENAIKYCEGAGFWKKGDTVKILKESGHIYTPFADYVTKEHRKQFS